MSSLNTVRLPTGEEITISEWLHWPLYSTLELGAGDGINLLAFSYVESQPVARTQSIAPRNATLANTNLVRRTKMGQDEALVVYSITYEAFGLTDVVTTDSVPQPVAPAPMTHATALMQLQRETVVELHVGAGIKKAQVEAPFSYIPQAVGAPAWTSGDGRAAGIPLGIWYGTGGRITPRSQRVLQLPVYIGGFGENASPGNSMYFDLAYRAPNGAPLTATQQDFRLRWYLDGLRKRPA